MFDAGLAISNEKRRCVYEDLSPQAAKRAFFTDTIEAEHDELYGSDVIAARFSQQCRFGRSQIPLKKLDESGHMYTIGQRVMHVY